jgi:ubiquinone biosynthesis protein COQ4
VQIIQNLKKELKKLIFAYRFMRIVQLPYGSFGAGGNLSDAAIDPESLNQIVQFLSRTERGRIALAEKKPLGKIDLEQLHQLPSNTLGYIYADHMLKNGLTPPPGREHTSDTYRYLFNYVMETHDIWHVVTGSNTDKSGEIQVETFSLTQFYPARFWVVLLAKNFLKTAIEDMDLCSQHMEAFVRGWIMGQQAQPLFGVPWNTLWEQPLDEIRAELNIRPYLGSELEAAIKWRNEEITAKSELVGVK